MIKPIGRIQGIRSRTESYHVLPVVPRKAVAEVWFVETHGWQSDLMGKKKWLRLWIFLSVHLSCLVTSLYLSVSVCLILLVCLPSASQRVYLFSYLVFCLSIFYLGIRSSLNQFCCHLLICASAHICAHWSIDPSVYLLYPSISPSISSISQRCIYLSIYLSNYNYISIQF